MRGVASRSGARSMSMEIDPNFESRLPELLKVGLSTDRPDADIAKQLRARYKTISDTKSKAAKILKTENPELAAELEEIADELTETSEKFVALSQSWDAWNRPDPDLARKLRQQYDRKKENEDEREDALRDMTKGMGERPDPNLPSTLRMMKYKNSAEVKRMAAKEVRAKDPKLAEELEDMADEIEDSHKRFEVMVSDMKTRDNNRPKLKGKSSEWRE